MPEEGKKQNWFMKHKVITGILVVIVLFVIIGSSRGSKSPQSSTNSGSGSQQQTEAPKVAKIGEIAQSGDLAFTVAGVKDATTLGNSFTEKKAQGVFKVVTLKIANTGKDTKTVDSSMIKLKDSQGRTFERSVDGQTAIGLSQGHVDLFLQQVQPSLSVTGDIVFDIPADAQGLTLEVQGSIFSSATEISLQK